MQITEKDLEDMIFMDIERGCPNCYDRGLEIPLLWESHENKVYWYRQVNLGAYGIADLVGFTRQDGNIYVNIVELKNIPLTAKDFNQVFRYKTGVSEIIKSTFKRKVRFAIEVFLIGPSIDDGHYIQNESNITLFTFEFSLDGFQFDKKTSGWVRTDAKKMSANAVSYSDRRIMVPENYMESNG
jgi:hypothetical protein